MMGFPFNFKVKSVLHFICMTPIWPYLRPEPVFFSIKWTWASHKGLTTNTTLHAKICTKISSKDIDEVLAEVGRGLV